LAVATLKYSIDSLSHHCNQILTNQSLKLDFYKSGWIFTKPGSLIQTMAEVKLLPDLYSKVAE